MPYLISDFMYILSKIRSGGRNLWQFVAFFVFFSGLSLDVNAGAKERCLDMRIEPAVEVAIQNAKTALNRSKSSSQIQRFAKKVDGLRSSKKRNLLGLAFVSMQHEISVEVLAHKIDGRYCARLKTVRLLFGREKSTIYVSRKYPAGTCEFKAILAHENEHMEINARVQSKYEAKLKRALEDSAKVIQPFLTTNHKAAPKALAARFASDTKPIMKAFQEERAALNARIDTPKSYQKTRSLCANW